MDGAGLLFCVACVRALSAARAGRRAFAARRSIGARRRNELSLSKNYMVWEEPLLFTAGYDIIAMIIQRAAYRAER